jgi:thymidine kinase
MSIELVIGPMFSGKTRAVMERARQATLGMKRVAVIKYAHDTRYERSSLIASHDGGRMQAISCTSLLEDPPELPANVEVIVVDEGQFMQGLAAFCVRHQRAGRSIHVAALNSHGDADRTGWPEVLELVPRATTIRSELATCALCNNPRAECSRSLGGDLVIGGADKYISTCAACYNHPITVEILERRQGAIDQVRWLTCVE